MSSLITFTRYTWLLMNVRWYIGQSCMSTTDGHSTRVLTATFPITLPPVLERIVDDSFDHENIGRKTDLLKSPVLLQLVQIAGAFDRATPTEALILDEWSVTPLTVDHHGHDLLLSGILV